MIDAAVEWIDAAPRTADETAELKAWAATRGLRLVEPGEGGRHAIPIDLGVANRIEEDLKATRDLLAQHDADGTERALARAEGLLRDHPELPQAAWLMAEVERGWATRYARLEPVDAARAARAWRAAAALDGGRASGVGEPTADADGSVTFGLEVAEGHGELRLDGERVVPGTVQARPGLHQLVAESDGAVVFASWITLATGTLVRVALPTPEPCSRADLAQASSVQCPSWLAVRRGQAPGSFRVRTCEGASCGPELVVASMEPLHDGHDRAPIEHHRMPKWLTWTLVGAGVVAVGVAAAYTGWWLATPYGQVTSWHQGTIDSK